ncbi:Uma2 family endonuclease [Anthocerotibacter panamensis]|uniref:Uma2 family endonuclease n=1 Tax=Anthocerotibacter panamensis TaxID=2857077 RepID=UPI001C405FA5|nr:Uma2 family endonuclease [Anthocerotibacter panamensis]
MAELLSDAEFQTQLKMHGVTLPPTQEDLPYDDGEPMETGRHRLQMELLINPLQQWLGERPSFVAGNMFLYYSLAQVRNRDFKGPDVFVVLDVPARERKSWVIWEEEKAPDVVIELLSESTVQVDKGRKMTVYQNQIRVPEYFWYDPFNPEDFQGFRLSVGVYEGIALDAEGRLYSTELNLYLKPWLGFFHGIEATWLRWFTADGQPLPTDEEQAQVAQQKARVAQEKAQQAQEKAQQAQEKAQQAQEKAQQAEEKVQAAEQKNARLAQRLRELGLDPEAL